ncbi:DUF4065 domain-containing protein [Aerococcaceae bacterium zg-ZUI334]|uniref:Panacea domain-containing protein n=1 Tax=Aerococcaceae bacterium zg-252 TaxID=2796928 RepID=UPI001B9D9749|nr:DUF4065 domain-containing protein [Aerococcaceae bacterium zg-ZUI334]
MANVFDVACYILDKKPSITTMKLQKLCYYCQAWSLAWDEKPLFEEDFLAYANGPVCYELYSKHRGEFVANKSMFEAFLSGADFTEDEIETMDVVLADYGDKEPYWLSELTHKERPWKETRGNLPLGARSDAVISKMLIQEYYSGLLTDEE